MPDPKTYPLSDDTLLVDLNPKRFLQVEDLTQRWKVPGIIVTVAKVQREETCPKPGDIDPDTHKPRIKIMPVLYFNNKAGKLFERGYLLSSRVDLDSLRSSTGAVTLKDLIGKRIQITTGIFKSKKVLRIHPEPVIDRSASVESEPAPVQPEAVKA